MKPPRGWWFVAAIALALATLLLWFGRDSPAPPPEAPALDGSSRPQSDRRPERPAHERPTRDRDSRP